MNIVIVDDELSAREILECLLQRLHSEHTIVGIYKNLLEAVDGIKESKPDLVFLDIEMPEYAGYEIIDFFEEIDFKIVFVTAYSQYALKAFEISAVDYLLKPIEIKRLANAIEKVSKMVEIDEYRARIGKFANHLKQPEQRISHLVRGFTESIVYSDIIALEAQRAYTKIYSKSGNSVVISKNIKQFENEFSDTQKFVRIHRSWIINLDELIKFSKTKLEVHLTNGTVAKLSKKYTSTIEDMINMKNEYPKK